MKYIVHFLLVVLVLSGCSDEVKKNTLFDELPADQTGIDFINELKEDERLNILTFEYFYNGAGVGVGDFNNDSLPDLFFASNMGDSRIYLNKGNFKFTDITDASGIDTRGKWATGVSIVDINQDGNADIYLSFAGPHTAGKRANELYINNGNNRFTERARDYGLADTGHTVQAVFFDYDRDDDLDCYLLTNITDEMGPNIIRPKRINGEMANTDRLYRNNGDGSFTNVSREAGILKEGYGLGVAVLDINMDGWPDIFVSNDYLSNDLLYINNKNGTFSDQAAAAFKHTSYSAMGNDVGDINNDGLPDLVEVDMLPPDNYRQKLMLGGTNHDRYRSELQVGYDPQFMRNSLHLHQGLNERKLPYFSEIGQYAGVSATDWSWSPLLADFDNDGRRDLFITNGYPRDITNRDFITYQSQGLSRVDPTQPLNAAQFATLQQLEGAYLNNFMFRNVGEMRFADQSEKWGFSRDAYSTGAAYADFDNDGDLDLVVVNTGKPAFVYRNKINEQTKNSFIRLRFKGKDGNKGGLGTKIWLHYSGQVIYQEHQVVRGYQSSVDDRITIGLGSAEKIDSVLVEWPDGVRQRFLAPVVNAELVLEYTSEESLPQKEVLATEPLFRLVNTASGIHFKHRETPYTDFNIQPLLPHKFSMGGPGMAVADLNGDGLDDFFIGGAYNQSGELFIQQAGGQFVKRILDAGKKNQEDMGAVFFDADGDGDQDLYVVSGGNEFQEGSVYYRDRLYLNDGNGGFKPAPDALPSTTASGSAVVAADYDKDGDLDLFVGGRIRPQHYPESGQSQLLENVGGRFIDVTEKRASGLEAAGMVNDAVWADINQDGWMDLVVVGEWMPVSVWVNKAGHFENQTSALGLDKTVGWWNSIKTGDFNKDGKVDFVLGNHGLNSRYAGSWDTEGAALGIYWYDFANVGNRNAIITYANKGAIYPIHPRDDLMMQLPGLRKKFPLYSDYAKARITDLFSAELLNKAEYREVKEWRSTVLLNRDDSAWSMVPLPVEAQLFPVFGILVKDLNKDGMDDLLLTGNDNSYEVINGSMDAGYGLVLKGIGDGGFRLLQGTGFFVPGNGKSIGELKEGLVLVAENDGNMLVWEEGDRKGEKGGIGYGRRREK
ncbi:VCBS repeat-containing protein [Flavihumibacter sp. UBA7668]|uniref:VCBS repeat-containing protein n=1 Tax=Flavihumibacter sp. UBA7668 TaxID=1946542 RepID=UPI0025B9F7F5|nr:VCBS repeat-containing protein [Flavihumibacter sp. UBA7668]